MGFLGFEIYDEDLKKKIVRIYYFEKVECGSKKMLKI